jgi:hypothetical protein
MGRSQQKGLEFRTVVLESCSTSSWQILDVIPNDHGFPEQQVLTPTCFLMPNIRIHLRSAKLLSKYKLLQKRLLHKYNYEYKGDLIYSFYIKLVNYGQIIVDYVMACHTVVFTQHFSLVAMIIQCDNETGMNHLLSRFEGL